jgi:predicted amidophosphoribosyltransferase
MSMGNIAYANCKKCGKIFRRVNSPICPGCGEDEEADLRKLKEYLYDNPGESLAKVAEATQIPPKRILKFIQDGRIELTQGLSDEKLLSCTRCGDSINTGVMCGDCKVEFNQDVQSLRRESVEGKKLTGAGMHSAPRPQDGRRRR